MTDSSLLESKLKTPFIQSQIEQYLNAKAYVREALKQRELYNKVLENYDPQTAPDSVRGLCIISKNTVKSGVKSVFAQGVEGILQDIAYKICKYLDVKEDEPMVPFVEALIRKYNLDPDAQNQKDSPTP